MANSHALPDSRLVLPERLARRRPRKWALWFLALAAAGVAAAPLLAPRESTEKYRTAPVERRTVVAVVEATGRIDVTSRVEVPSTSSGRLAEIFAEAGATVESGQPLAQIDEESTRALVSSARARIAAAQGRVAEAQAALDAAADTRKRTLALAARGLASDGEVASVRAAEARSQAALQVARAERSGATASASSAEIDRKSRTIRAPIGGVVLSAPKWTGRVVGPEQGALFVIGSDTKVLRIEASVPEADIGSVRIGQAAQFSVPAYPDRSFRAAVDARSTEPDREASVTSYVVTLSAENPDGTLLPGMTATVRIEVGRSESALAVREPALRFLPDSAEETKPRSRVFRLSGGNLAPVEVQPGISDATYTQIEPRDGSALRPGDLVVIGLLPRANDGDEGPGITLGTRK